MGDVVLSKPIKPLYVIFFKKSILYQHDNDVLAGRLIVNIYIVYNTSSKTINSSFVFKNCLFGAVKILLILILINGNIRVMALDLIQKENLHILMEVTVEMLLFLELI